MKTSKLAILLFFISANRCLVQDHVFKSKRIQLSFQKIQEKDSLINLEFYQNVSFSEIGQHQDFHLDSLTHVYTFSYSYSGIGGGEKNYLKCPELIVKLNFLIKNKNETHEYFILIPIVLEVCEKSNLRDITVSNIDLNQLINHSNKLILINENNNYTIINHEDLQPQLILKKLIKIKFDLR